MSFTYFCFKVKVLAPYWKMELLELFNVLFWVMQIFRSNFRPLNNVLERNDFNNFMLNSVTTLRKNEVWARWPDPQCCIKCFFFKIQWTVRISSLQDWKHTIFLVISFFSNFFLLFFWHWPFCFEFFAIFRAKIMQLKYFDETVTSLIFLFLFFWSGDVRPIDPKNKFCSNFEAVTIMRPGLIFLNSENDLKEKLYHLYWGVRSSSANFVFIKSVTLNIC